MSYVMFENTYNDLYECFQALHDGKELSKREEEFKQMLIDLCNDMIADHG